MDLNIQLQSHMNAQVDSSATQHMNPHHEWLVEGIIWTIISVIFQIVHYTKTYHP
jgi:hypothetical protein